MASFEGTIALRKRKRKGEGEKPPTPGPSFLASFQRGVETSPVLSKQVASVDETRLPENPDFTPPPSAMTPEQYYALREQRMGRPDRDTVIPEAQDYSGRFAEALGRNSPLMAAGAMAAPLMAGSLPVGAVLSADMLGGAAGSAVEATGAGTLPTIAAEIGTAAMSPTVGFPKLARRVLGASARAGSAAADIAQKYGFSEGAVTKVANDLRSMIAEGTEDADRFVRKAPGELEQVSADFVGAKPTTAQALQEMGGQNLASLELQLAKKDPEFARRALGRRLEGRESLDAELSAFRPDGTMGGVTDAGNAAYDAAKLEERAAWQAADLEGLPDFDTSGLKRAYKKVKSGPKADALFIPKEARVIEELGETASVAEAQALRSQLLDTMRGSKSKLAPSADRKVGPQAAPLLEELQKVVDNVPGDPGDAYKAARSISKRNATRFDIESRAMKALIGKEDPQQFVNAIRGAGKPSEEARKLMGMVGADGVPQVRAVFVDELATKTISSQKKILRDKSGMYREIFGDEGLDTLNRLIRKAEINSRGKAGTYGQAASVGSGQSMIDDLAAYAVNGGGGSVAMSLFRGAKNVAERRSQYQALLKELMLDVDMAKDLLDLPAESLDAKRMLFLQNAVQRARATTARSIPQRTVGNE